MFGPRRWPGGIAAFGSMRSSDMVICSASGQSARAGMKPPSDSRWITPWTLIVSIRSGRTPRLDVRGCGRMRIDGRTGRSGESCDGPLDRAYTVSLPGIDPANLTREQFRPAECHIHLACSDQRLLRHADGPLSCSTRSRRSQCPEGPSAALPTLELLAGRTRPSARRTSCVVRSKDAPSIAASSSRSAAAIHTSLRRRPVAGLSLTIPFRCLSQVCSAAQRNRVIAARSRRKKPGRTEPPRGSGRHGGYENLAAGLRLWLCVLGHLDRRFKL